MAGGLEGRSIVVPESRELDLFAGMLEKQGARAIRCPLVTILDVEDEGPARAWLGRLAAGGFDDLVLFTGEGLRRLLGIAERAGTRPAVEAALRNVRTIVRGPKPVRALRTIGLEPDVVAAEPTSEGVIATLAGLDLAGRLVGLQAYPGQGPAVDAFLAERGATAERVLPYRYASHEEDSRVADVIDAMARGEVDAIAFTSRPQVERLRDVAARHGREEALDRAMRRVRIAAVGPVVGSAVEAAGWSVAVAPTESFHMKPMIVTMRALFAQAEPAAA